MTQLKAGDRIQDFVLLDRVGEGTFGEVWRARHHAAESLMRGGTSAEALAAIKVPTDPQYVRNLQTAGRMIYGLNHPNIVKCMGFGPYAQPPYLIMEYVDGPTLAELIAKHPDGMPLEAAVTILQGILEGLAFAHESGLIHRDIKPANVLIADGEDLEQVTAADVRITDFGLGKVLKETSKSIQEAGSLETQAGRSIVGSIAYMSPEQRDGEEVDERTDLYSCGMLLFEMLTGRLPRGADRPSRHRPDLPEWVDELFERCYTDRQERFASAKEMVEELDRRAAGEVVRPRMLPRARPPGVPDVCPKCGTGVEADDNFCIKCGHQVNAHPPRCANCQAYVDASSKYCIFCGGSLTTPG